MTIGDQDNHRDIHALFGTLVALSSERASSMTVAWSATMAKNSRRWHLTRSRSSFLHGDMAATLHDSILLEGTIEQSNRYTCLPSVGFLRPSKPR